MQKALHIRTTVLPGGKIEIVDDELEAGEDVDVIISPAPRPSARSAWQVISEAPGHLVFKTAAEVKAYLAEEKGAWGR